MILKRIFDFVVSLFGLIIISPVLLIVSIIIGIKMGFPIFYKQHRIGQYGIEFTMIKFRTMINNSGKDINTITIKGESRITELGKKLRKYKIDELPEIWNVLKGDMSFVGPRPDVPKYLNKIIEIDKDILKLKPGITGPASMKYRNEEEILANVENPIKYNDEVIFPDKVRINKNYLLNRSFFGDIKIILFTVLNKKLKEDYYK